MPAHSTVILARRRTSLKETNSISAPIGRPIIRIRGAGRPAPGKRWRCYDPRVAGSTSSFGRAQGGPKCEQGSEAIGETVNQLVARIIREGTDYGDKAFLRNEVTAASPVSLPECSRSTHRPFGAAQGTPRAVKPDRRGTPNRFGRSGRSPRAFLHDPGRGVGARSRARPGCRSVKLAISPGTVNWRRRIRDH